MELQSLFTGVVVAAALSVVLFASPAQAETAIRIPLSVSMVDQANVSGEPEYIGSPFPREHRPLPVTIPVWTGVPLARGAVSDAATLRLLNKDGKAVPAQFDVEATWDDGSAKWVLVSFFTDGDTGYTLTNDPAIEPAKIAQPVDVFDDTNECTLTTGPMRIRMNTQGMRGLSQVWLDTDGDGRYTYENLISTEADPCGIVATDEKGRLFTSAAGRIHAVEVERAGPLHAVAAIRGDLQNPDVPRPLLNYTMRVHAFAGSSLVRVVLTAHNPRAATRAEDGSRYILGQPGAVLLESLEYVLPVQLNVGLRQVTLSPEPGRMLDRLPLVAPVSVYQDSSGGENWFHRTHVNRNNEIPLRFKGYQVHYKDRQVETGLHATPWVDVADLKWAVSVAMPAFWQNFPKGLGVDDNGTIRVGLWPAQFGDLHEIQGGEQKTHEFWVYYRHRRALPSQDEGQEGRRRRDPSRMALARELMPVCLNRPVVWADSGAYAAAGADLDPLVPVRDGRFDKYEAVVAAGVNGRDNLFTHRARYDEYGWRHFGDTWAANERNKTEGPHHGLDVVSHYNNEYDLGFGMLMQSLRNVDARPGMAHAWWDLAVQGLWHEADIDIYHTLEDRAPIYNGGTFTHTAHGVEAGRSTHRGSPTDHLWGLLDWPWAQGSSPEAGHFRTRGILTAYYLTGDRHLVDAARDATRLVHWKIQQDRFPQIGTPDRSGGNNLQILLDWYLLTGDKEYLDSIDKLTASLDFDVVVKRFGEWRPRQAWSGALYIKNLGRLIDVYGRQGLPTEKLVESYLKFARTMYEVSYERLGGWREGTWSYLACEAMAQAAGITPDPAEREKFLTAAGDAFRALDDSVGADGLAPFRSSKSLTMILQGGGAYMQTQVDGATDAAAASRSDSGAGVQAGAQADGE